MSSNEWKEVNLGCLCDFNKASYSTNESWDYVNYLDTGNITENRIDSIQQIDLSKEKLPSRARRKVDKDDIVYSTVRPIQKHYGIIKNPLDNMLVSTGFSTITANKDIVSPQFVYYYLTQNQIIDELQAIAEQQVSTYPSIKASDIESLKIMLPSLSEQKTIADTLSCLDDMIELNDRINQVLEEIAQAIFKRWFVDFEFPNEDGQPYKSSGGEMVESELGEIPKGWKVVKLSDIFEINPTRRINRGTIAPYLEMSNMPTQGHFPISWVQREVGSGVKFMNGDTLVARITPCLENGKTAYIDFLEENQVGWGSTEYILLRPREPVSTVVAYILARSDRFRDYAIKRMTGSSGRQRVPSDNLALFQIAMPPLENPIHNRFRVVIESLFDSMRVSAQQSRVISEIRDTLLPKLMSGEIRVPIEEVG